MRMTSISFSSHTSFFLPPVYADWGWVTPRICGLWVLLVWLVIFGGERQGVRDGLLRLWFRRLRSAGSAISKSGTVASVSHANLKAKPAGSRAKESWCTGGRKVPTSQLKAGGFLSLSVLVY